MNLEYYLQQSNLGNTKTLHGQPSYRDSLDQEQVILEMLQRNSGMSREMIIGVLNLLLEVLTDRLKQGYRINLDLVNMALVIKGTFEDKYERFDTDKHQVKLQATEGKVLRKRLKHFVPTRVTKGGQYIPMIERYHDVADESSSVIVPGSIGKLSGFNLKVNTDDPEQGLYAVSREGERFHIPLLVISKPSKLVFQVPKDLPAGEYQFEVTYQRSERGKYLTGYSKKWYTAE